MAAAERHERYVRLIVPGEKEDVEDVNPFAKIYYVPAKFSPVFDKRYRIMMPWQYMVKDSIIRKILLAEMPDMVEVTDKYTLSLIGPMVRRKGFQQLGRPMLVHFSCERMDDNIGSFLSGGKAGKWFARRIIGDYTMPNFDYHLANSTYTAEEFYSALSPAERGSAKFLNACWRFFKAPRVEYKERIFVCPRGVNSVLFNPERRSDSVKDELRTRAGIPSDAVILLYAGRISPEKNIGLLPEMMAALAKIDDRDYRLVVAGAGPQSDWLKEQGEKLAHGKIVQLGHLEKEQLADYYANADVFVHPNPKEPFGIAPLEAMASGVPTVAPNAGGILSYATNENAWLVEPTGEAFAAAVKDVIDNPGSSEAKVQRALETARSNTRESSTDRLFATYDKIYEDFLARNELFTDFDAPKDFDYVELFRSAETAKTGG
jgi:glycosyltransferase involved in cell wall biosynthesis